MLRAVEDDFISAAEAISKIAEATGLRRSDISRYLNAQCLPDEHLDSIRESVVLREIRLIRRRLKRGTSGLPRSDRSFVVVITH